ncbi:MAG: hypothetical protein ACYTGN_16820 [Planctomycetota bacterium]
MNTRLDTGLALLLFFAACGGKDDTSKWRAALEDRSPERRCEAAAHLARAGDAAGLDLLLDHAQSLDDQEWRAAARYLPTIRKLPSSALDRVATGKERVRVVRALGAVGPQAKPYVALVTVALTDKQDDVLRIEAAWALFRVAREARRATETLLRELGAAESPGLRQTIADRLLGVANEAPQTLIEALDDERTEESAAALLAQVRKDSPGHAAATAALAKRARPEPD